MNSNTCSSRGLAAPGRRCLGVLALLLAGCAASRPGSDAAAEASTVDVSAPDVVSDAAASDQSAPDAPADAGEDRAEPPDAAPDTQPEASSMPPANADCAAARRLAVGTTLRNEDPSLAPRTDRCLRSNSRSLYYSVPLAPGQVVQVAVTGGTTDGIAELPMCGGCPLSTGTIRRSIILQNTTTAPRDVLVEADADSFGSSFDLTATDVPAATNTTCAAARALTGTTSLPLQRHPGDAMGAPFLVSGCRSFSFMNPVLFYRVTVPAGQTLTAQTTTSNMSVFEGCAPTMCLATASLSGRLTYTNSTAAPRELIVAVDSPNVFNLDVTVGP